MVKKQSDTSRSVEPSEIDDLKLINGIGPAVERRLHGVGIYTYTQLAALSPADIAAAVAGLSGLTTERITRQDWIGQARELMSESISSEAQEKVEAPAKPVIPPPVVSQVELVAPASEKAEYAPLVVDEPELASPIVEVIEPVPPGTKEAEITPPVVAITGSVSMPRLLGIVTASAGAPIPQNFLPHDQPFDVHLTLDLSDLRVPDYTQFSYKASIYGKSLDGHPRQIVGKASGFFTSSDIVTIEVPGTELPEGNYRLLAVVTLRSMTVEPEPRTEFIASTEGGLLLVS